MADLLVASQPVRHLGRAGREHRPGRIVDIDRPQGTGQQLRGHLGNRVQACLRNPGQPLDHPPVRNVRHRKQMPRHDVNASAGGGQLPCQVAVQSDPGRGGRLLDQHLLDQFVPEPQPRPGGVHGTSGYGFLDHAGQLRHRPAGADRQLVEVEVVAQQRGDPQHACGVGGREPQPAPDGHRERLRHGAGLPVELGDSIGHVDEPVPEQSADQLLDIQRVPACPGQFAAQQRPRPGVQDACGDRVYLCVAEWTELHHLSPPVENQVPQPSHGGPVGHRPAGADQQQRNLVDRAGKPVPQQQARLVGPVQVVGNQNDGSVRALPVHQFQQALAGGQYGIDRAGVGLAPQ
jgi:hypothetical protein